MESWKTSFVHYFERGIKTGLEERLGVEIEHFIIDQEKRRTVSYEGDGGVKEILTRLMELCPGSEVIPDDAFLGFTAEQYGITLEPAAQIEISIVPMSRIRDIGSVYAAFMDTLRRVLPEGCRAVTCGVQPVNCVEELPLIPKRRYALMDAHFQKTGTGGREMMRGTASVQVSIDYASEEDLRRKVQAAYWYSPLLKLLCDNAPYDQGRPSGSRLLRTDIWNRVDPVRCGILPGIFSESFGFADYADFIGAMPPIFIKENGEIRPTGFQTVSELYIGKELSEEEIAHVLSMAFPDVRLKQFLEIRVADSVPYPFMLAYTALIKGLLCREEGLSFAQEQIRSRHLSAADIRKAEQSLMQNGWDGEVYGRPAREAAEEILAMARRSLPEEEKNYSDVFHEVIRAGGIAYMTA